MTDVAPASALRIAPKRVEYIDLLRGWAVIVMIETHVINATLSADLAKGPFFEVLNFINGLVAPSFLFASGLAYAITTRRKVNDYLSLGFPLFRQVGRLLLVLSIGYMLHIPRFNYYHLRYEAGARAWENFFQVDVLHCIAVSLLLLQGLLLLLRSERLLYRTMIGVTLVVVFATPLMWGIEFRNFLPVPVAAYMNGLHDSLFPLFPWSAFLFAGAITGYYSVESKEKKRLDPASGGEQGFMRLLVRVALAVVLISFVLHPLASALYPTYDYWRSSPSFYLLRLGLVVLLAVGMFFYEQANGVSPRSVVTLIGRESLIVYTTHLLLVYGDFGKFNFNTMVNKSFGYPEAVGVALILFLLMIGLATVWSRIKRGPPVVRYGVEALALAVFLYVFYFGLGGLVV